MQTIQGFVRRTKQREVILRVLRSTRSHPTAEWVYQQVRKELPRISLGTVYRNLRILTQSGQAQELRYSRSYSRFDGTPTNHYHFVCEQCGRVDDVPMPVQEKLDRAVELLMGVQVRQHRLEFYGTCADCRKRGGEPRPGDERRPGGEPPSPAGLEGRRRTEAP